jgi:formate dehydrogenase subunit delta
MDADKLVRMANQIAANLDCGPNEAQAVAMVADHIRRFWSPLMRRQIIERWRQRPTEFSARASQAVAAIAEQQAVAS